MNLLVVIPCLNEEATVGEVIRGIPRQIEGIDRVDVLVVDDGSTDRSRAVAEEAGAHVISHKRNLGVGQALQTAVAYALENDYDILTNIDADGQFNTQQIPLLVKPIIDDDADFVAGSRFMNDQPIEHMPPVKRWGNARMNQLISRLAGQTFCDVSCGFRAYSRHALCRLNLHNQFTYTQETFLNLAFNHVRILQVPIDVTYFPGRESRVANSIWKYAFRTSNIIFRTYRDYQPLRFFWTIGALVLFPALMLLAFFLGWRLFSGHFSPHIWAGFSGTALFFFATLFFIVGLIADMLARIRKNQEDVLYCLKRNGKL
jgi:glycosyltransferase involved in cell wall biosynthesis